jgi:hypothetical protein
LLHEEGKTWSTPDKRDIIRDSLRHTFLKLLVVNRLIARQNMTLS